MSYSGLQMGCASVRLSVRFRVADLTFPWRLMHLLRRLALPAGTPTR